MTISNELLDELLKGCKRPDDLLGEAGLMKELKIRLMERMLGAELTAHLGYEAGAEAPQEQSNRRNGISTKRVKGSDGEVPLSVPRDRDGSFEPELVKKGQTRIDCKCWITNPQKCWRNIPHLSGSAISRAGDGRLHF
jgi:putative transposase